MFLTYISAVILFVSATHGANILAALPTPSYSHQIAFEGLWKELSLRGHKVTLLTTNPVNDPKLINLTEIDTSFAYKFFKNISKLAEESITVANFHKLCGELSHAVSTAYLSHSYIQELINNTSVKYDIVISEFIYPEFLAFAEIHKCPKILFGTLDVTVPFHEAMGNTIHPQLYPDLGMPFYMAKSFKDRLMSTLFTWQSLYYHKYRIFFDRDENVKKYFKLNIKTEDLIRNTDLLLININPAIHAVRAVGPNTIYVGDLRRTVNVKPLPTDLKKFLDGANKGFVYFSLGSNVKSKELKKESLKNLLEALSEIPYKVLWKFEDDYLPGKPDNVKLVKWTPQQAVLAHPNIKLFVTQGGLQSMEEGIANEVPFVVIPFFGDQDHNADLLKNKGISLVVDRNPYIRKQDLKEAILEVVGNPKYKKAVIKLKQLALDTPMTGIEKGVWWIEYVIRNKGAKHLRNPAADIPFYQYYLLDVIGFLVAAFASVLTVLFVLVRKAANFIKYLLSRSLKESKKVR